MVIAVILGGRFDLNQSQHFCTNMRHRDEQKKNAEIRIMSNDLSQIKATPLPTFPACSLQIISHVFIQI